LILLTNKSTTVDFPELRRRIKPNFGDAVYYRVSYSPEMFEKGEVAIEFAFRRKIASTCLGPGPLVQPSAPQPASYPGCDRVALDPRKTTAIWQDLLGRLGFIDDLQRSRL